jgi:hypothetical protein
LVNQKKREVGTQGDSRMIRGEKKSTGTFDEKNTFFLHEKDHRATTKK